MVILTLAFADDTPELTPAEIDRAIAELERQLIEQQS
jgi:hypothetical protein